MRALREALRFFRAHLFHLAAAPLLGLTLVTLLHEGAHAAAAWAQGARVTELSILPGGGAYGHVRYQGAVPLPGLVSLSPYLLWVALATAAAAWGLARPPARPKLASALFVWGYVVPLLDVANAVVGWLLGADNDLRHALGPPRAGHFAGAALFALAAAVVGFGVQGALYGPRALSPWGFLATCALGTAALGAALALLSPLTA